jgi:hypothetical protein
VIGDCGLKLSIVIPVFNELSSLPIILNKMVTSLPQVDKEIIVCRRRAFRRLASWLGKRGSRLQCINSGKISRSRNFLSVAPERMIGWYD